MKAILYIKTPEKCSECPCEYDFLRCKADPLGRTPHFDDEGIPKWCPLHRMEDDARVIVDHVREEQ